MESNDIGDVVCSKGDLENAVKCLELYVEVAERSGASEPVANACSAAGIMFNSLVCGHSPLIHFFYPFLHLIHPFVHFIHPFLHFISPFVHSSIHLFIHLSIHVG